MTEVAIVGWAHSPFGKLPDADAESLIARVSRASLEDAAIPGSDIDGVFVGHFNAGFCAQGFPSSLAMNDIPSLRMKPEVRVENACASAAAAVFAARDFIAAGRGRLALVIGVEKMTGVPSSVAGSRLLSDVTVGRKTR